MGQKSQKEKKISNIVDKIFKLVTKRQTKQYNSREQICLKSKL